MKKGVVAIGFIFLSLVFLALASAACTNSNQTILKLYSSNNTHAALWNDSVYSQDICYDSIFGAPYVGTNSHACAGNVVLKLSNTNNSHAEVANSNVFPAPVQVCYGNLVCGSYTGSCPAGTNAIVRLSNTTNAHLSIASQNPGNAYNTLICCSSTSAGSANWINMVGQIINLQNVSVNNSVILDVQGIQANIPVTFSVYRNTGMSSIRMFTNVSNSNGKVSVVWKITDSDMAGISRNEFYFKALNAGYGIDATSPKLYANNSNVNVAPKCAIISPVLASVHAAGESIALRTNSNAEDPDSIVTINWKVVNESTNTQEMSLANESATYLALPGTKTIVLNVTDDAGNYCYNTTAISVFAPVNVGENPKTQVFAWINKPLENEVVPSLEYKANYSVSASYAYNVTPGTCGSLVCVAGVCPAVTISCGTGSISMTGSPQSYASLNISWTFDGIFSSSASGLGKINGSKTYASSGDKIIRVSVSYGAVIDTKTRRFNLMSGCERVGNNAYRVSINSNGQLVRVDTRNVIGACEGASLGTEDDCCPNGGWICADSPGGKLCQQPVDSAATCDDYLDSTSCNADIQHVGNNASYYMNAPDVYNFYNCSKPFVDTSGNQYIVVCGQVGSGNGCVWYDGSCRLNVSLQQQNPPGILLPGCLYKSTLGECVGGYQNVSIEGINVGGNVLDCTSLNRQEVVLCGRTGVRLPFFDGILQFVIALLIVALIYYIIRKSLFKKIKHKKK